MHHYAIAKESIEAAIEKATEQGWSETDVLQSFIVLAVERYQQAASPKDAKAILEFEVQNLGGKVDFDFVRSR